MSDITAAIQNAWEILRPRLERDPLELARRLARRRTKTLMRPQRAWCIAIRASDSRLQPDNTPILPPSDDLFEGPECPRLRREHRVVITADNLRMLCQPIRLSPWGHTAREVARLLGVHECAINAAIRRGGIFRVELSRRGRFGKLVNVLRADRLFDASAKNFEPPDPVFGSLWPWLAEMIPEDFEQTLDRVPAIQNYRPPQFNRPRRPGSPRIDPLALNPRPPKHRPPPPEGGRRGEAVTPQQQGALATRIDPLARIPSPLHLRKTKPRFNGWKWICPACRKTVRTLYYPITPTSFPVFFDLDHLLRAHARHALHPNPPRTRLRPTAPPKRPPNTDSILDDLDTIHPQPGTFACWTCHGVRTFHRYGPNAWNELIHHLSGGLLYGHEVKRPTWVPHTRKQAFHRFTHRAPSKRRAQVLALLLKGQTYNAIAHQLGLAYATVHNHIQKLYHQHEVHSRQELIEKLTASNTSLEPASPAALVPSPGTPKEG